MVLNLQLIPVAHQTQNLWNHSKAYSQLWRLQIGPTICLPIIFTPSCTFLTFVHKASPNLTKIYIFKNCLIGTSATAMMTNCNNEWVYIKLVNEKISLCATSETYQEENKKICWKQFEYTDLGQ